MKKDLTGYPHIDKPWMKYYDEKKAKEELPKKTIYENMKDNTENMQDKTAITYYGKKINYGEFNENVELSSKILSAIGVKVQDRVLYLMPNIPETAYTLYGNNKIGGVSDYVDPRPDSTDFKISSKKVLDIIKKEHIKHIVVLDQCYLAMIKPIEYELRDLGITNIMLVIPSKTMNLAQNGSYIDESIKFNGLKATINKLKYNKFIAEKLSEAIKTSPIDIIEYNNMVNNVSKVVTNNVGYKPKTLTAITHSSGTTTGMPKPIPLVNEGIISYSHQLHRSNVNVGYGDSSLQILPYFSAYGLGIANMGFSSGDNMIEVPEFEPKNLGKLIKKYHPEILIGTPNWYLSMPKDKTLTKEDLSYLKVIGYGGDSMNPNDEKVINDFLAKHNSKEKITKGHGMSEISGGSSYATGEYNVLGSMGIPMIDTIYGVVDPITKEPLKFDEKHDTITGELIISSPATVAEKLDGNTVIKHGTYDGKDYVYTGDIATMDKNGVLYFEGRMDRAFTRYDGFKVKPYVLENIIKKEPYVKDCLVTSYYDDSKFGNMTKANIILKEGVETSKDLVETIINNCFIENPNTSTRQIPTKYSFLEEYPQTKNGKVDYHALEKSTENDYNITLDETSVSVNNIKIIEPNSKRLVKTLPKR